jgi:hypothetical protein
MGVPEQVETREGQLGQPFRQTLKTRMQLRPLVQSERRELRIFLDHKQRSRDALHSCKSFIHHGARRTFFR